MRLMGTVKSQPVVILIDTGSTHSFVDQNLAKKIQLPAQKKSQMTVMVANGDTIPCPNRCTKVFINLQGYHFQTSLYLLTLRGCDMVLGVDWLSTLGPILWNFTELTMKFTQQNREVVLRSLVPAANNLEMARKFQRMQEGRRPKCK
jgi:predicted aspartyl protease